MKKYKKGAASFYIVSFSTLILVIIAASFATIIISEVTRASNDDLSQSAYDSALAGVEDAKLAYANYRRCIETNHTVAVKPDGDGMVSCGEIIWWMQNADCDMVAHIIGRIPDYESGEVVISDTTSTDGSGTTSDLNQAYTCSKIETVVPDIRANLSSSSNYRLVRANFDNGVTAKDIGSVKLSWYSVRDGQKYNFSNFGVIDSEPRVTFMPLSATIQPPTPPTLELQMVQTAEEFTISQVNGMTTSGGQTDRATLFFVPVGSGSAHAASKSNGFNYEGVYDSEKEINVVTKSQVAATNNQAISKKPFVVYCDNNPDSDFMCEVTIMLPEPIGGTRNNDTFMFLVTLPYGEPDTDFALQFICKDSGAVCSTVTSEDDDEVLTLGNTVNVKDVQILVDSTGRTNDLYRRVEARFESSETSFPFIYYGLQILKTEDGDAGTITKDMKVLKEHNRDYWD